MGFLLETGKYTWKRNNGKWIKVGRSAGLHLTEAFRKGLSFHKARISFNCRSCEEQRPKNTRYLGGEWEKICVDCVMEWIKESEKTMKEITQMLYERKFELSENKEKWRKEQILGALEGGE